MKPELLRWLACPRCGAEPRFSKLERLPLGGRGDVDEGRLACPGCRAEYPIEAGVPRLLREPPQGGLRRTRESFAFEWDRYPGSLPEDESIFLEETMLDGSAFKDKLVLDAGCGMGRYSVVALSLGAELVAVDLSDALLRVAALAPRWPRLHAVQGDLLAPPFKPRQFDVVYSQGVLHHTPDTKAAFMAVAKLVKPGGLLSVWLYGKAGRYADFLSNPLRSKGGFTARHRRLAWLIVGVRHLVSDLIRAFTTRLPLRLVYALSWGLAALGGVPLVKYLTFSVHGDIRVRAIENFDWISPPYQFHHTKEELAGWFEEAGFDVLKFLPHGLVPKPGALGRKRR